MKKFLAIALIAGSFVACNEGEKKEETTVTETPTEVTTPDTTVVTTPDTTVVVTPDTTVVKP